MSEATAVGASAPDPETLGEAAEAVAADKPHGLGVVYLGVGAVNLGAAMIHPVYGPWARELGFSEAQAGFVVTFAALAIAISSPPMGRLSDRLGRRFVMALGLCTFGIGFSAFALAGQFGPALGLSGWLLLLVWMFTRGLAATGFSAAQVSSQAYIADVTTPAQRGGALGLLGAVGGLGLVLGPPLGGLAAKISLGAPILLAGAFALAGALLVAFALPPSKPQSNEEAGRMPWRDPRVLPLLPLAALAMAGLGALQVCAGFLVQDRLGVGATEAAQSVGMAMLASGVALVVAQVGVVKQLGWAPRRLLRVGLPLAALAFALVAVPGPYALLVVAFGLLGLGLGMVFPGAQAALSLAVEPHEQGATAGLAGAANAAGYMVGPAVGGLLYGVHHAAPFALAALALAGAAASMWLHPRLRGLPTQA